MLVHPALLYVTIYVWVAAGDTVTVAARPFTGDIATVGVHAYVPPDGVPVAVSVVLWPVHRLVSGEVTETVVAELIVRTIESTAEQPEMLSVTVRR